MPELFQPARRSFRRLPFLLLAAAAWPGSVLGVESQGTIESALARDNYQLGLDRYGADLMIEGNGLGARARARWYAYSLTQDLVGIHPFSGGEPALEAGGHWLSGSWWSSLALGFQGSPTLAGILGSLVVARAFSLSEATLTPRLDVGRKPLSLAAMPLSLGLFSRYVEAALAWQSPGWTGDLVLRTEAWEAATAPGRVENPSLAELPSNQQSTAYAYFLSRRGWLHGGLLGKVQHAQHGTLAPTRIEPLYAYTWYPVSAPLLAWEAALVVRVLGNPTPSLELLAQVQVPFLSRETREWQVPGQASVRTTSWGAAAWEGSARLAWNMTTTTRLSLAVAVFAKPWADWNVAAAAAYRQVSLTAGITQRF